MKALQWTAVLGLAPGYGPEASLSQFDAAVRYESLRLEWQRWVLEENLRSGFSVSAFMTLGSVVYCQSHGCPRGGEFAVSISGSSNPEFVPEWDLPAFAAAVERMVLRAKDFLEQETVRIEFVEVYKSVYVTKDPR